ncbi:hypothetical protein ACQEVF_40225 [Nonomuraea polychroma]|uniref:hypothetical protein n=1 Tax=Nonomuraea polychroma TaxID=46176 RepID=UPI003D917FED
MRSLPLLPTWLVGSYAQPEWLIDRAKLAGRFPPRVRASCPGRRPPARWRSDWRQAQNDHYPDAEAAAMDYAAAVNAEIRDLFAAGADIVQIDEPYMQARPEAARAYGLAALNAALDGVEGTTALHICFGYAAIIHDRPEAYSFLPELAGCPVQQAVWGAGLETALGNGGQATATAGGTRRAGGPAMV